LHKRYSKGDKEMLRMEVSILDGCILKARLPMLALTIVISHAITAFAQQTTTPPTPAAIDSAALHPGMGCNVSLKIPLQPDNEPACNSSNHFAGTIEKVTKDEIVVRHISEGVNEIRTPILGSLPYIGRFFTRVEYGRSDFTVRIPVDKITKLEVLGSKPASTPRH
jgi:hypothetical protein